MTGFAKPTETNAFPSNNRGNGQQKQADAWLNMTMELPNGKSRAVGGIPLNSEQVLHGKLIENQGVFEDVEVPVQFAKGSVKLKFHINVMADSEEDLESIFG